ncbi:MAG: hypothetical protein ACFE8J_18035, partial [Candidatus Heimdallarchaeota archaeon]
IDFAFGPTYSLVIACDSDAEDTIDLIKSIQKEYLMNKVIIHRKTEHEFPDMDKLSNFIKFFIKLDNKAIAYVCINKTCQPPTSDPQKIISYLNAVWKF